MSFYLSIEAAGTPAYTAQDASRRHMFTFTLDAVSRASVQASWTGDIAKIISDAGLGVIDTDLFISPGHVIPVGQGPFIGVTAAGGAGRTHTHGSPATRSTYENYTALVSVRGLIHNDTESLAFDIWRALDGIRNQTVT